MKHSHTKPSRLLCRIATALLSLHCAGALAANIVVNGDFESGNTGFDTQYIYAATCSGVGTEGVYTVDTHNCYGVGTGGPSGSGNVYFANGAVDTTQYVWRQDLTVTAGAKYYFSAHAASGVASNPPELLIQTSNDGACAGAASFTTIGSITTPSIVWQWTQNSGFFTAPGADVCLRLMNNNAVASGNDFGLDDIVVDSVYAVAASAAPGAGGTVSCTPANPMLGALPNEVLNGDDADCTATPNAGYTFTGWAGDCAGPGNVCNLVNITSDKTATANFALIGPPGGGGAHAIPTLSEWALLALSALMALAMVFTLRRQW